MSNQELLEARYGRKKTAARDAKVAKVLAAVLGSLLLIWIFVVTFFAPAKADANVSGFKALSETQAIIKGMVTKPADRSAICGVIARNRTLSPVGYTEVQVGPGDASVAFEISLSTTELAGSGAITECILN